MSHSVTVFPEGSFIRDLCLIRDDYETRSCSSLIMIKYNTVTPRMSIIEDNLFFYSSKIKPNSRSEVLLQDPGYL